MSSNPAHGPRSGKAISYDLQDKSLLGKIITITVMITIIIIYHCHHHLHQHHYSHQYHKNNNNVYDSFNDNNDIIF